jgi:glycerol-3-phosphate acyltransferase PlsY
MNAWIMIPCVAMAYLLGSTPTGLLVVRLATGQDVRRMNSGRTGGTNVARVAGVWAGLVTGLLDGLKGAAAVWVARGLAGGIAWGEAAAALAAVVGHNYSLFLIERTGGRLRFRGGAGGATTMGAAIALWAPSALIIPLALVALFIVGYASVATMSVGLFTTGTFLWRAITGRGPWEFVAFGLVASIVLAWSLRPNIQRLMSGSERLVGLRAYLRRRRELGRTAGSPVGRDVSHPPDEAGRASDHPTQSI